MNVVFSDLFSPQSSVHMARARLSILREATVKLAPWSSRPTVKSAPSHPLAVARLPGSRLENQGSRTRGVKTDGDVTVSAVRG